MKRSMLIISTMLLLPLQSFAEISIGLDFYSWFRNDINRQNANNRTNTADYDLRIVPTLLYPLADNIELAPFAGFTAGTWRQYRDDSLINDNSYTGFVLGCGLYFRLIDNDVLRFSIGPKATFGTDFEHDSEAFGTTTSLGAPANIDLLFNDRFFMRMSPVLAEICYMHRHIGKDNYQGTFDFNIITQTGVSIGFFLTF